MGDLDPNNSRWPVTSEGFVLIPGFQRLVRVCFTSIALDHLFERERVRKQGEAQRERERRSRLLAEQEA